jgi:hypothetical protein
MWVGSGKHHTTDHGAAAVKLGVRLQVTAGGLIGPQRDHALTSDYRLPIQQTPAAAGTRSRADLGLFDWTARADQRGGRMVGAAVAPTIRPLQRGRGTARPAHVAGDGWPAVG